AHRGVASMNLQSTPFRSEVEEGYSIGNLAALLAEIAARLERLSAGGKGGAIDLRALPFSPEEYDALRQHLGRGEVSVRIEAIGPSEIFETRYPGLWWVTHCNAEGDIISDLLEITNIPEIIKSHPHDIRAGLASFRAQFDREVQ
ncbi:MAG: hydrogenase expression/formation C-terminal domain-containing protein, partial [Burkholderiales bacterium]